MKQIFIHVGAGKTGTSALQRFFCINEKLLEEKGVFFPSAGRVHGHGGIQHHPLSAHGGYKGKSEDALSGWKEISLIEKDKLVISSEYFHSRMAEKSGESFFKEIKQLLAGFDTRIVFYVRRHSDWLESAYSQFVKNHNQSLNFDEFTQHYKKNIFKQVLSFSEVFGKDSIIVRPYEKSQFFDRRLEKDFLNAIGVEWDNDFVLESENINPRLSLDALEFKRIANKYGSPQELTLLRRMLLEYSKHVSDSPSFSRASLLSADKRNQLEMSCSDLYKDIATDFLNRPDGVLFIEDIKDDGLSERKVGKEDLVELLIYLFCKHINQ